jgi:hypothetical protein
LHYPCVITGAPNTSACAAKIWSAGFFLIIDTSPPTSVKVANVTSAEFAIVTNLLVVPLFTSRTSIAFKKVEADPTLVAQAASDPKNLFDIVFSYEDLLRLFLRFFAHLIARSLRFAAFLDLDTPEVFFTFQPFFVSMIGITFSWASSFS